MLGTTFRSVSGNSPFPYQTRLGETLLAGESVILRAPTGAGKTWAAVVPFLHSFVTHAPIADRLIYSLPLRSLASSLHRTVIDGISKSHLFAHVSDVAKDRDYTIPGFCCSLQMGGRKDDPFFESDLVFTTIDQVLSAYLMMPLSLPPKLDNMVAGALAGSLLVFDEIHLLDSRSALGTTIEMLDRMKGLCPFVLMTATLSDSGMRTLARQLGAQAVIIPDGEIRQLPSQATKQRTWLWRSEPLTAARVIESHSGGRSLAIVNTVSRAQRLFEELRDHYAGTGVRLLLLHSRFYAEDRQRTESELARYLGPEATSTNVILVSTQVVEAGIDISADTLHTELAPMNTLVQRAGRTARYKSRPSGRVVVYEPPNRKPYVEDGPLLDATLVRLQGLPAAGEVINFAQEQSWVDEVHADEELRNLGKFDNLHARRSRVKEAIGEGNRGLLAELVRDIDSVNVFITAEPEKANFTGFDPQGKRIGWPKLLGIPRSSIMTLSAAISSGTGWVAKCPSDPDPESSSDRFQWRAVETPGMLRSQWLLAIHPDHATYDSELGLRLGLGGVAGDLEYAERPPVPRYQYEFEPWVVHAERVRWQARSMHAAHRCAAQWLAQKHHTTVDRLEELLELTCILHDAGKLSIGWQAAAWAWQRDKDLRMGRTKRTEVPIAHTEWDPRLDWAFRNKPEYNFPHHAVEGAFACTAVIDAHFPELGVCGTTAIARHHAARARKLSPFKLISQAAREIAALCAGQGLRKSADGPTDFDERALLELDEQDEELWPLYEFLVRRLRLADQGSLRN